MAKVGRPQKYTEPVINEMVQKFADYINDTELPIVAEFAYMNDIDRKYLYDHEEFSALLKKCKSKKETALERGAISGAYVPSVAIFSLKQLGWSDKQEIQHSGEIKTTLTREQRMSRIEELKNKIGL
jgi:UTP-glucose-1-phosphate uridylyltransferase